MPLSVISIMKKEILYFVVLLSVILIHNGSPVASQGIEYASRKWYEFNRTLYRIAAEPESKWKEANAQCRKEKMALINPTPKSNRIELHYFIKTKFQQFPAFWAQNNVTDATFMQKIGFKKGGKGQKCNKIDHMTFEIKAEECGKPLGFICQTTLHSGYSEFQVKKQKYHIEPKNVYSCGEARTACEKRNMTMVVLNAYKANVLLNDYVFLRYGFNPSFWLAKSNTSQECFPWTKISLIAKGAQHGFICEKTVVNPLLSFRHIVLICCVSVALVISIIVLIACKCYLNRKTEDIKHEVQEKEKEKK